MMDQPQQVAISQHLAGIEDAVRIERALERAHQVIATGSLIGRQKSRFMMPMPCSAEIEPPYFSTTSNTTSLTSSQRSRNSALSAPTGCVDVVVDVAVAEMAERQRPRAGNELRHGRVGLAR